MPWVTPREDTRVAHAAGYRPSSEVTRQVETNVQRTAKQKRTGKRGEGARRERGRISEITDGADQRGRISGGGSARQPEPSIVVAADAGRVTPAPPPPATGRRLLCVAADAGRESSEITARCSASRACRHPPRRRSRGGRCPCRPSRSCYLRRRSPGRRGRAHKQDAACKRFASVADLVEGPPACPAPLIPE